MHQDPDLIFSGIFNWCMYLCAKETDYIRWQGFIYVYAYATVLSWDKSMHHYPKPIVFFEIEYVNFISLALCSDTKMLKGMLNV